MKDRILFTLILGLCSLALCNVGVIADEIDEFSDSLKEAVGGRTRDGKLCKQGGIQKPKMDLKGGREGQA